MNPIPSNWRALAILACIAAIGLFFYGCSFRDERFLWGSFGLFSLGMQFMVLHYLFVISRRE